MRIYKLLIDHFLGIYVLVSCLSAPLPTAGIKDQQPLAFVHVNVIPMTESGVLEDQTVVIERGKITRIGPSASVRLPRNVSQIDGREEYLMPGPGADSFGTVAVGQRADLLLLNANPLAKIDNISQIAGVTVRGRWLSREQLEKMRSEAVASFAR